MVIQPWRIWLLRLIWLASLGCMTVRTLGGVMVWGTWGIWLAAVAAIMTACILTQNIVRGERVRAAAIAAITIDKYRQAVAEEETKAMLRLVEDETS